MSEIAIRFHLPLSEFSLEVNLAFPVQGVTAIFGSSGSGKTTLLRCIAGLEQPPAGYCRMDGELWQESAQGVFIPTHQRSLGYVFQEASLFAHLTVAENLRFGWRRTPVHERKIEIDQVIGLLGIEPLLRRSPARLSGGERQRVAIARALLTTPRLLLMDEPLSALDSASKAEILPFLERLHDELTIPILYVSHASDEVLRLADHLLLMEAGRVTTHGPMVELATRLDLQLAQSESASALVNAIVEGHDDHYHLTYLRFSGGRLTVSRENLEKGHPVRVALHAKDISLTLDPPERTSILNSFAVTVLAFQSEPPARTLIRLDCHGTILLARITWKSAEALGITVGKKLYAQVKAVALMDSR
ncbi:MAG: molybdenum ABC transporter ATP-binding protein [Gammaproteobacteria bacterium]|nr:molybdenum ABC transporter ATP-binding protein [Gammaproteobacteria bacterium]